MRRSDSLSAKDRRLLAALLANPSTKAAASAAGVSETTAFRKLRRPDFRAALERTAEQAFAVALAALRDAAVEASALLRAVVQAGKAGEQRKAATAILALAIRARELDLERRVRALEERLGA